MRKLILVNYSFIYLLFCSSAYSAEFFQLQWGLQNSGQPQSIELDFVNNYKVQARPGVDIGWSSQTKNKKKILVAVLDTGIDKTHPALVGKVKRNESECKALEKYLTCIEKEGQEKCDKTWLNLSNPEVDLDKNGYPLDCQGWSVLGKINSAGILGSPDFSDDQGHGTHVAGIIAAAGEILGVASSAEILPVQVLGKKPNEPLKPLSTDPVDISAGELGKEAYHSTLGDYVARGVNYAIASGAKVINFSLGWPEGFDSEYLQKVIAEAQARGIFIVAAAGNDSTRALLRPCAYAGVICVGSHGPDGSISHFSNYGSGVDLVAPGTNILSTYPEEIRPVRFKNTQGYEYLHGTSQAAPFVAGIIAELLARGVPESEIYPRLILGSQALLTKLPLLSGPLQDLKQEPINPNENKIEGKFVLSGRVNLKQALWVKPQALILPSKKEKLEIIWNPKDTRVVMQIPFKNHWQAILQSEIKTNVKIVKSHQKALRPSVVSVSWQNSESPLWSEKEERVLEILLDVSDSRIASDLDVMVELNYGNSIATSNIAKRFIVEADIIAPFGKENFSDFSAYEIPLQFQERISTWLYVDERFDKNPQHDYFGRKAGPTFAEYFLIKQTDTQKNSPYKIVGSGFKINLIDETPDVLNEFLRMRLANSEYALGVLFDRSEKAEAFSELKLHKFNSEMKLRQRYIISNEFAQIPSKIYWQKIAGELQPTWTGIGLDPDKKPSLRDEWDKQVSTEKPEFRLFFFNQKNKMTALQKHSGYQISDILEPSSEQIEKGIVPLLLAKNRGTQSKNSYIYDFATAELSEGRIQNLRPLNLFLDKLNYRNLLDTRVDRVLSLDYQPIYSKGTFWFGEGVEKSQRVSMLLPSADFSRFEFFDQFLKPHRGVVDTTLRVRSAFYSKDRVGVFAFTNSEVQYHDLKIQAEKKSSISRSLERYTFWDDYAFDSLHFPIVVEDQDQRNQKIPALFVTEEFKISKGFKVKMPYYDPQSGELIEIMSPAKLRFRNEKNKGCRALNAPLFDGASGASSFDYYCGDKLIRVPLVF